MMKQQVSPAVAIIVVLVALCGIGFFLWRQTGGRSPSEGRLKSDLDTSLMEKDPAKFKQELDALIQRDKAARQAQ
jgi:hypothetical protein